MSTRDAGARYESLALLHVQNAGLVLLARNFSCRYGELDLVMQDRDVVVFVEVRYRRGAASGARGFGDGLDSISSAKRMKLARAARMFLASQPRLSNRACRFDVLAIAGTETQPSVEWLKNAFDVS